MRNNDFNDRDYVNRKPSMEIIYCTCLAPIIQLFPEEKCMDCKKPIKPKRKKK